MKLNHVKDKLLEQVEDMITSFIFALEHRELRTPEEIRAAKLYCTHCLNEAYFGKYYFSEIFLCNTMIKFWCFNYINEKYFNENTIFNKMATVFLMDVFIEGYFSAKSPLEEEAAFYFSSEFLEKTLIPEVFYPYLMEKLKYLLPEWELEEIALVLGLIFAEKALEYFKSSSSKKHLMGGALLKGATEADSFWSQIRGITNCRNPELRLVKAKVNREQRRLDGYLRKVMSEKARNAANKGHNKAGGSRDLAEKIRKRWAQGNHLTKDGCAEKEYQRLGFNCFGTARKALKNAPDPNPWPAKEQSKKQSKTR